MPPKSGLHQSTFKIFPFRFYMLPTFPPPCIPLLSLTMPHSSSSQYLFIFPLPKMPFSFLPNILFPPVKIISVSPNMKSLIILFLSLTPGHPGVINLLSELFLLLECGNTHYDIVFPTPHWLRRSFCIEWIKWVNFVALLVFQKPDSLLCSSSLRWN